MDILECGLEGLIHSGGQHSCSCIMYYSLTDGVIFIEKLNCIHVLLCSGRMSWIESRHG